jgi:hypothetical protein
MRYTVTTLCLLLGLTGCSRPERGTAPASGHHHHAPHGGVLVELGEHQAALEFKFDGARGVLQAWVFDGHAENFVRIEALGFELEARAGGAVHVLQFTPVASAITGETVGHTATFEAPAEWLRAAKAFDGRLKAITVRGSPYTDIAFSFSTNHAEHPHQH